MRKTYQANLKIFCVLSPSLLGDGSQPRCMTYFYFRIEFFRTYCFRPFVAAPFSTFERSSSILEVREFYCYFSWGVNPGGLCLNWSIPTKSKFRGGETFLKVKLKKEEKLSGLHSEPIFQSPQEFVLIDHFAPMWSRYWSLSLRSNWATP